MSTDLVISTGSGTDTQLPAVCTKIESLLAAASTISEVKEVVAMLAAAITYARKYKAEVADLKFLKVQAERRLGEMLKATPDAKTGPKTELRTNAEHNSVPSLSDLGIDRKTSSRAQRLASIPTEVWAQIKAGEITVAAALNTETKSTAKSQIKPKKTEFLKQLANMTMHDHAYVMVLRLAEVTRDFDQQTWDILWDLRNCLDQVLEEPATRREAA